MHSVCVSVVYFLLLLFPLLFRFPFILFYFILCAHTYGAFSFSCTEHTCIHQQQLTIESTVSECTIQKDNNNNNNIFLYVSPFTIHSPNTHMCAYKRIFSCETIQFPILSIPFLACSLNQPRREEKIKKNGPEKDFFHRIY